MSSRGRPRRGRCRRRRDWTFFGHALVNQALRQPDTFVRQFRRAFVTIYGWEKKLGIEPSHYEPAERRQAPRDQLSATAVVPDSPPTEEHETVPLGRPT